MKMFNVFKKNTICVENTNEHGMEKFDGTVIEIDTEEIESITTMPEF
jgi:hypothetical protein